MNNNQFNVGDMIRSKAKTKAKKELYLIVSKVVPSALIYKVIYLHDGVEGILAFKYAHKFYVLESERT